MDSYTLYLDESTTHSGRFNDNVFCMAGIIVKDEDYIKLENKLNDIKTNSWSDCSNPKAVILHQMQISDAIRSRSDNSIVVHSDYKRFKINQNCRNFYNALGQVFDLGIIKVIGATLDTKELNKLFKCGNNPDPYLITLQLILENYCHFLCNNNGRGKILYESRDFIADQNLKDRFYHIKLMGSMYITKNTMEKRLMSIEFEKKEMNNSGLQIADFVPNYFARKYRGFKPNKFNIDDKLRVYRYDGGLYMHNRFGVKNMP